MDEARGNEPTNDQQNWDLEEDRFCFPNSGRYPKGPSKSQYEAKGEDDKEVVWDGDNDRRVRRSPNLGITSGPLLCR